MAADVVRFGDGLELDRTAYELRRSGRPLKLERIPMEILLLLIGRRGQLVSREEIIERIWGKDVFVDTDNSINSAVRKIRQVLKDDPENPVFIQTVTGKGYRFVAVTEAGIRAPHENAVAGLVAEAPAIGPGAIAPALPDQIGMVVQTPRERIHLVLEEETSQPTNGRPIRRSGRWVRVSLWIGAGVVMVALATFAGFGWKYPRTFGHAEAVIADLDNETGDADFDHSLNRMLQIDLQQSPYFTLVSEGRKRDTLKTMRQPVDEHITEPLAREICERLNGQLYITAAIASVGGHYLVSLEANDCADGHSLGSGHEEVSSKNEVLGALTGLTRQVRRDAGESSASLRHFDKPLFNSYTASLDALKAYSEATRFATAGKNAEAITLYRRAIELDPKFAVAYGDMASTYFNIGDDAHDREAITKAYALRYTVNDYERFFIEYGYHNSVTGDLHAQLDTLRQWTATYPNDSIPLAALVNLETQVAAYGNAAFYADRALDLQRRSNIHNATAYDIAARAYHHANMPDKLRFTYAEAMKSNADSQGLHATMLEFAAENDDSAGVERQIAWSRGKPDESRILLFAALAALAAGQARRADTLFAEATSAAQRDKQEDILADYEEYHGRMLVELGLTQKAKALLKRLSHTGDPSPDRLFTEAQTGNAAKALAEAQRQQDAAPNDVLMKAESTPSVHAVIALRQGKPDEAIKQLQADAPYELRNPTIPYLRGQAYFAAHQGPQAAAEFAKLVDRPWLADPPSPLIPLAHLGLARALALQSQFTASRKQYETLFVLWKDADPDLPVLLKAHQEYAKLP